MGRQLSLRVVAIAVDLHAHYISSKMTSYLPVGARENRQLFRLIGRSIATFVCDSVGVKSQNWGAVRCAGRPPLFTIGCSNPRVRLYLVFLARQRKRERIVCLLLLVGVRASERAWGTLVSLTLEGGKYMRSRGLSVFAGCRRQHSTAPKRKSIETFPRAWVAGDRHYQSSGYGTTRYISRTFSGINIELTHIYSRAIISAGTGLVLIYIWCERLEGGKAVQRVL